MIKLTKIAILILGVLLLIGCGGKAGSKVAVRSDVRDIRAASLNLADSAQSINFSLQELAAIERARNPVPKFANPLNPRLIGMEQIVQVDWIGPIGPFVEKIAKISKYKLRVLGKPPAIPIIVSITAKNVLLADVLRNANYQCKQRANIALYASNRVIELRYAKN